jgi:hypothetical protein
VIEGPEAMRVLIRGVGPSLIAFGISDAVGRPTLRIYRSTGQQIAGLHPATS